MSEPNILQIEVYLQCAEERIIEAETADAETQEGLYQEATDLLIRAEHVIKGSGA